MAKPKGAPRNKTVGKLPSKQDIIDFLATATGEAGKREIARAFGVKGGDRIALKALLRDMADDGLIAGSRRKLTRPGVLPPVTVIEITGRDADGEFIARPSVWDEEHGAPPRILMAESKREAGPVAGVGDRVLARITALGPDTDYPYQARTIKRLAQTARSLLGIFRALPGGTGVIDPVERKQLKEWPVARGATGDAENGELVRFEIARASRVGVQTARVIERLGNPAAQQMTSLIAVHAHGIPDRFPEAALAEAEAAKEPELKRREDLRHLPLVTIDPSDARDHDDAVWAEADPNPANRGGWVVIVAIADVASYVRPGSALDKEARKRGNSVYFPDRVVPMLPERISNDLCSLIENEPRPCLAVRMVFDKDGGKLGHRFFRALMRSAASLTYEQAQSAIDGRLDEVSGPLLEPVLRPLWGAYASLVLARTERGPLNLDLPERKILLDEKGRVRGVASPPRLDAHRLIEEFMIAANVAAAETLEAKRSPLIYRVHDSPSKEKLASLGEFLSTIGIKLPKSGTLKPAQFNRILAETRATPTAELVGEVILRSQAQAEYSPGNFGHFGLNLRKYVHFTSPIRRYADLLVHRALVRALGFGAGGLEDSEVPRLAEVAKQISEAERRAMAAERETVDRLIAAHLADRVGATFEGRIAGVTRSGLFVRLKDTGADGFVPVSSLTRDFFQHLEGEHALVGNRTGETFRLGDVVSVRLVEAIPSAGALRFEMLTEGKRGSASLGRLKGRHEQRHRRPRR
ncbi:MAG: ribonuclease R [Methyloceanibacter sp.]